ncbi:transcriptional coactivator/pterin dehydratase [Plenodomus tracheiphilus IPT5]|uniref:4a-hydroxytetrahydrobiopterin dehydratase n=1 Tax=Plenodomus tracheiphilus IPT5 TaxID=1408161 RepID=A0A6A7BEV2_9PLEO|nr:transcriptional coactivator/pterin dehydratase [Plenodomus tracheiphilus IPT5]
MTHLRLLSHALPSQLEKIFSTVVFSQGQPADLPNRVKILMSTWRITNFGKGLTRSFTFKSFQEAWEFMSIVAAKCKTLNHHPTWTNTYNQVRIIWTTHKPEGLSAKDVEMAEFCNQTADKLVRQRKGPTSLG